jgi:hypothetical protein
MVGDQAAALVHDGVFPQNLFDGVADRRQGYSSSCIEYLFVV